MRLTNNVAYQVNGQFYVAPSSDTALITGSNNLWFGSGPPPEFLTGNLGADPLFVDLSSGSRRYLRGVRRAGARGFGLEPVLTS